MTQHFFQDSTMKRLVWQYVRSGMEKLDLNPGSSFEIMFFKKRRSIGVGSIITMMGTQITTTTSAISVSCGRAWIALGIDANATSSSSLSKLLVHVCG